MDGDLLLVAAAVIALAVAVVESQRRTNAQASARAWRRSYQTEHAVVERLAKRIERLETALGRREPGVWLPRRHRPPATQAKPLSDAELAEWLAETEPSVYPRFPYAEYQPGNDQVCHRKPRVGRIGEVGAA